VNPDSGILVLMYHRVGPAQNAWEARYAIGAERFDAQMRALARRGLRAVPLDALCAWLDGGAALPPGAFVLTFDDGFRGVRDHALPVLERLGWPATVFLVSNHIGGDDAWTRLANPAGTTHPLLDTEEIADMQRRAISFQSHTCSHASLPTLDDTQLAAELVESRSALQQLLGRPVEYLAYPFGHVDDRVVAAARNAGYRAALSTQPGFNRRGVDRFRIRRLDVYGTDTPAMLTRKTLLGTNDGTLSNLTSYYVGRVRDRLRLGVR
jgi:peptidoglycan/xylan/chitin deacetylase (PgdA/CDA1 family)